MSAAALSYDCEVRTGSLIRKLRKASGMSQRALADKIGVSYQQVQKYEYGTCGITVGRLRQIAWALDVPVGLFIGDAEGGAHGDFEELRVVVLFRSIRSRKLRQAAVQMLDAMAEAR